jgi:hypothetical protein
MAVNERKEGPVTAGSHVLACMKFGSELTHEDVASFHKLTVSALYATVLRI